MTKAELLEKIKTGNDQFVHLLSTLSADQIIQSGVVGNWSVKDIVAHIAVHEQRMLEWMDEKIRGGNPAAFQPYAMPDVELAMVNEGIYQANRGRVWLDVLQDLENVQTRTLSFINTAQKEDLMTTQRFQLLEGEPLWMAVAANTYDHREEHGRDIRAWMEKRK